MSAFHHKRIIEEFRLHTTGRSRLCVDCALATAQGDGGASA